MTIRLGIDFGTTRTVVAAQEIGNYPVCTFSWQGETKEYIPTLVGVKDGILHFGWDAAYLLNHPDAFILRSMKRLAGQFRPEDPVDLGPDFSITLLEVVTLFLNHVRQMVTKHGNISLKKKDALEVMVATPANANSNQHYITLEGFRKAGFTVLGAMNEPSAVAVEFLHRHLRDLEPRSPKRYVAVYDLGGGTFDTSVVGIADPSHEVLAHEGIAGLGGDDFDEIILNLALEQIGLTQETFTPNDRARLLEECRERKEGLKSNTKKMVIDLATVLRDQKPVILDTGLVYERCGQLIERSLKSLQSLLGGIDQNPEQSQSFAGVYLVGGSVPFPPVARKIREIYPSKVRVSPLPHASTAIGLSIASDPKAKVEVRESVCRHFGIWRERDKNKVIDPIFHKDRPLDSGTGLHRGTRTNKPAHNIGLLQYLQCRSIGKGKEPEGSISLRQDVFQPHDPKLQEREDLSKIFIERYPEVSSQEITGTCEYNEQETIQVEIKNKSSGYKKLFTFERPKSPNQISEDIECVDANACGIVFKSVGTKLKELAHFHLDPVEERPVGIEVEIRKTGRIRRKRIRWHRSAGVEVTNYRLYWSVGEPVGYDSQYVELDDVTEAILPDDIPSFPPVSGTVHLGITALNNTGNESDMTKISTSLDLLVQEAP
jgi:actin-like ATPase involved in cell morphogenesis